MSKKIEQHKRHTKHIYLAKLCEIFKRNCNSTNKKTGKILGKKKIFNQKDATYVNSMGEYKRSILFVRFMRLVKKKGD